MTASLATDAAMAAPPEPAARRRLPRGLGWAVLLGMLVLVSLAAGWLAPYPPNLQLADGLSATGDPLAPSAAHWLGTDDLGRDVLSRLLYGGRMSLMIAAAATGMAGALGVGLGLLAGYAGGRVDDAIMRLTEIVMAFPGLLLAIALAAVLPPGPGSAILTLGLVGWTSLARMVRGGVLQMREQEFMEAARAAGAEHLWMLGRHVWPNVRPLAATLLALKFADMLLLEAALGFLGLGVPPPDPTWGGMIGDAKAFFFRAPWLGGPSGLMIFLTVLAVNMLGERYGATKSR
jgi:peptide/nickel transport system permease protein